MFLLGYFDDGMPVMGLPGCVMYAGATIFDLILPRIAAGVEVTRADITAFGEKYMAENENVKISFNFDSSGKLYTQITEGAGCDLFISAAPKQMNQLDGTLKDDAEKNPDGLDLLVAGSRIDLPENKVALAVAEGAVDCGIIYASDAYSAGLTVAAFARALGEYGATSMVAGYTPGKTATVSTTVYQLWQINNDALAMKWVMVNMAISDEVLLRPVNGGEEVMLRAILPEGAAAAAGETVRFDLLAEKCLCCG